MYDVMGQMECLESTTFKRREKEKRRVGRRNEVLFPYFFYEYCSFYPLVVLFNLCNRPFWLENIYHSFQSTRFIQFFEFWGHFISQNMEGLTITNNIWKYTKPNSNAFRCTRHTPNSWNKQIKFHRILYTSYMKRIIK